MRNWRPIALLGLLAVVATLAFPGESSALSAVFITLTPSGPSPADMTISAGQFPFWRNADQVTHTITFADGTCSFQLAPGTSGTCPTPLYVGRYPYTVDGTTQASLVVTALPRDTVTMTAGRHALRHGERLRLHGRLAEYECCLPPGPRASLRVIVLARPDRHHRFQRLARGVSGRLGRSGSSYPWSLHVRPRTTTIYIARVTYHPVAEPGSRVAWSRPFRVTVSPPPG